MTVRAALFDVFGTVVDWRTGIAGHVDEWMDTRGVTGVDSFAFADEWRSRYDPSMREVREGRRPFARLDVLHRENLVEVLLSHRITASDDDVDALNSSWHALPAWPDSVAGITRMKSAMIVAPLSNGNVSLLLDMAKAAGIPWDAVLGAEVAHAYKPTPDAYLRTADILGLAPEECLMVAAHNSDLKAAQQCGFGTAFVRRPTEHGPSQTVDLEAGGQWDHVADSMEDLATALGC
ncbi:haloacid dehalogenase [Rhodococcoides trifolii]|uniref:Haloacid dehalogenase n=1 Tax=Rhodococcoides trifolii TaxID=908250 RepID=A0A917FXY0_9NOCA|nr:haloacid dehalogenase type II [Rhodococcus trifolii]GGG12969.1 haloacid dehalogenase [Rhodococcus trifolii]